MTDEEKQRIGVYYKIDQKRKVIIYDPSCNNHGKWDYKLENTVSNMAEIAKRERMPVEATFNGTTFQMTPGMSPKAGEKEYDLQCKIAWEKYEQTPEYKAKQEARAKEEAAKKLQQVRDDMLIRDEVLDLRGFERYFKYMESVNNNSFGKSILEYAKRWGKLMQAEMKKQGLDHLTSELVRDTDGRADIFGMSGASASCGRNLLIMTWKYGKELGKIEGFQEEQIDFERASKSDRAYEFYDNYPKNAVEPKDFEDGLTKAGHVIATVFQDEKLVDMFYKKLAEPSGIDEKEVQSYIPVLKLPSNEWQSFYEACSRAKKEIRQSRSNANDKPNSNG